VRQRGQGVHCLRRALQWSDRTPISPPDDLARNPHGLDRIKLPVLLSSPKFSLVLCLSTALISSCSANDVRGIADGRSDYKKFIPMQSDSAREGLRPVKPYFRSSDRSGVLRAIERACAGGRGGSSVYDERSEAGYYVNCNPRNRQLLNGYVARQASVRPHSR
jgi:hypothetical protein